MVTVPYSVSVGPLPALYPLVELRSRYEPFLLAAFEDLRIRLLWLDLGRVTAELLVGGTRQRQIRMIQHALSEMVVPRLAFVGTTSNVVRMCAECPPAVLSALVGTVSDRRRSRQETISAAIGIMESYYEKVSRKVTEEIAVNWEPSGSTTAGPVTTLQALASDNAETIWFSTGCRPEPALICAQYAKIEWKLVRPVSCLHCDGRSWYETDSREQIVHAAVRNGCAIRILWNQNAFDSLGGVVCAKWDTTTPGTPDLPSKPTAGPASPSGGVAQGQECGWFTRSAVAVG